MSEVLGIEEAPGWSKCMMKVMKGHTLRVKPFAKSAISEKLFSDGRCTEGSTSSHPLLLPYSPIQYARLRDGCLCTDYMILS